MKISEMEIYHDALTDLEAKIQSMLENRKFPEVFSACVMTFPTIVPSIRYRKKRNIEPEMPNLLAFHVICKYAPPLFEHIALTSLFEFVKSTRQLTKDKIGYIEMAESALEQEEMARSLWNYLAQHPNATEKDIGREMNWDHGAMREIIGVWEELSLVICRQEQDGIRLDFVTRLNSEMEGVCPNCGVRGKGPKEAFFRKTSCRKCGVEGHYHINYKYQQ
jgi:hypothetical protein